MLEPMTAMSIWVRISYSPEFELGVGAGDGHRARYGALYGRMGNAVWWNWFACPTGLDFKA